PGAGLGLSIVRSIAEAHGGTVTAEPGPEGGLAVTVTLPVAQVLSGRSGRTGPRGG
ncbi:HAMP domain-containing histidine kinase, partial [Streptomyces lunaelactis]|uniref:ATP-binding protein n=4 Tax=Streptomyces lunaelactis TaxID=1535768 RepID=UPI0015857B58